VLHHDITVPPDWTVLGESGTGPFVTRALLERPDGTRVEWTSRRHRRLDVLHRLDVLQCHHLRRHARRSEPPAGAVASRIPTSTSAVANLWLVNLGTFLGAIGFFVAAALLPVESTRGTAPVAAG
jgi:hypothetical protein